MTTSTKPKALSFEQHLHQADEDSPFFTPQIYSDLWDSWQLCRAMMRGTPGLREEAETLLPQFAAEDTDDWETRVERTELYPMFKVTVRGLAGLVTKKPVTLNDDVPADIQSHAENIDGQGNALPVFARQSFEEGLEIGIFGVLIDCAPNTTIARDDGKPPSQADEAAVGVRPYWVRYDAENILCPRFAVDKNGFVVLSSIMLHETVDQPVGEFGYQTVHQLRQFKRDLNQPEGQQVTVTVFDVDPTDPKKFTPQGTRDRVVTNVKAIPFVFFYIGRKVVNGFAEPPMIDLAYTNVAHAQVLSDRRNSLHKASVPILVFTGGAKVPVATVENADGTSEERVQKIGPDDAIETPEKGDVKYVEHNGNALEATRNELKDLETRAAVQGLSMLSDQTRSAITENAKKIDKSQQDATLASAAQTLGDGLEQCLAFHAQYMKKDTGGSVTVNSDFNNLTMDAVMITALSGLVTADQLDLETLWQLLADAGVLPDDFNKEDVLKRIMDRLKLMQPRVALPSNDPNAVIPPDGTTSTDVQGDANLLQ